MTATMPASVILTTGDIVRLALDGRPQTWLAQRAGVSQHVLCRALNGHIPMTRGHWDKLRSALPELPTWEAIATFELAAEPTAK